MFQWTDDDVASLLTLTWRIARFANPPHYPPSRTIAESVAGEIGAAGWTWSSGSFAAGESDGAWKWSGSSASEVAPLFASLATPESRYRETLTEIIRAAQQTSSRQSLAFSLRADDRSQAAHLHAGHAAVWISIEPPGQVECFEFWRPVSDEPFGEKEIAKVRVVFASLGDGPRESPDATRLADSQAMLQRLRDLPKRQREVFVQLLHGNTAKVIAQDLGISHHTVNDYSKAIYRRFGVSGRGELVGKLIESYGLLRATESLT